jgi:parallel beta-helix repeat protein
MRQKILVTLVIIMFGTIFLHTALAEPAASNSKENRYINDFMILGENDEYTPREPISINGDDNFTEENGVTAGSGTQNDPYIIENWNVTYIHIYYTTKFFIINLCYVYDEGITFWDVSNGKIKECIVNSGSLYEAINLRDSNYNFIENCKVFSGKNGDSIDLISSNNNNIENCYISCSNNNYGTGISLSASNDNTIYRCIIEQCRYGIYLSGRSGSNNNVIHCCNISNCLEGGGIRLFESKNNKIYHNNFFENYYFIEPIKTRHHAEVSGGINQWDNGKEGNYWDNYKGLRFPRLYDWNNDGVGEIPYRILSAPLPWGLWFGPTYNRDRHPLMKPYIEN